MQKLFTNVLVPVDLGRQSVSAIRKAITIANQFQCNIHLLYVEKAILPPEKQLLQVLSEGEIDDTEKELWQLKERYTNRLEIGLQFHTAIRKGNKEQQIVEYALLHQIDLIIVGKPTRVLAANLFRSVNINRLSRKAGCPVLTVKTAATFDSIRNIVLPVDAHLPIRKIMFASYLARHYNARIHLIALSEPYPRAKVEDMVYLYKSYQLLRDNTNLNIECHTVPGGNIADTTLEYARQIDADLIVVNPGKELLLSGFINRLFARFIFNESRIPVMTVAPAVQP